MAIQAEDIKKLKKVKRLKHKYRAVRCEADGIKFPSKLERACYLVLKKMQANNQIRFFLRQVPFDLPSGYVHKIDYCIFTDENVIFIEAKGKDLPQGKMKRKQVEDLYLIDVFVVKQAVEIYEVVQAYG